MTDDTAVFTTGVTNAGTTDDTAVFTTGVTNAVTTNVTTAVTTDVTTGVTNLSRLIILGLCYNLRCEIDVVGIDTTHVTTYVATVKEGRTGGPEKSRSYLLLFLSPSLFRCPTSSVCEHAVSEQHRGVCKSSWSPQFRQMD